MDFLVLLQIADVHQIGSESRVMEVQMVSTWPDQKGHVLSEH